MSSLLLKEVHDKTKEIMTAVSQHCNCRGSNASGSLGNINGDMTGKKRGLYDHIIYLHKCVHTYKTVPALGNRCRAERNWGPGGKGALPRDYYA